MDGVESTLAVCGLDCAACTIFLAATHPEIAQRIADWFCRERGIEVRPEQIRCAGCRGDPAVQWSDLCTVRSCAQSRGWTLCSECPDFVCSTLIAWSEGDEKHAAAVARLKRIRGSA